MTYSDPRLRLKVDLDSSSPNPNYSGFTTYKQVNLEHAHSYGSIPGKAIFVIQNPFQA